MYKEINLPEVVAAIISAKGDNLMVKKVKFAEIKTAILDKDSFMKVDFSAPQYRRVDYLGDGHVRVGPKAVIVEKGLPIDVKSRFQMCYNSLDRESKAVLGESLKSVFK